MAGWTLAAALLLLTAGSGPPARPLVLRPAQLPFGPVAFRITEVRDERADRTAVAWLLLPAAGPSHSAPVVPQAVDLQGGLPTALQQFFRESLTSSAASRRVRVRVRECRIQETPGPGGTANGRVSLHLAFDWLRPGAAPVPLTEYRGGARYGRRAADASLVEPTLRQALADGLRYFHGWLAHAEAHDVRLATAVRPTFRSDRRRTEPDTLFYDPARPLTWADFTGRPRPGNFAAAVFPSFAYHCQPRVVQGVVVLDLTLQVFVVRSSSWVGPGQQTARNLNHEQRHFDIVQLIAQRFRRKATADSLTVEDYNSLLQLQYLKSFTEMNRLQDQYDAETHHGSDEAAQLRWDHRIDAELSEK